MRLIKKFIPYFVLSCIVGIFFYKTILSGSVPFPGDLLLSEYNPWRHTSYFGYVPGSIPNKGQYFDVIRELYPWRTLVTEAWKSGHIPLWNPYNLSGTPLLANYQSQVFYPLSILYLFIPQTIAWTLMVILQPLLGCFFLYLYGREINLSKKAAVISAVLFNFSFFASVWMEFTTVWHTILWLPLLLYIVEKAIQQKKLRIGQQILFVFALFSAITGGHPQDFINMFLFFLVYGGVRLFTEKTIPKKFSFAFRHIFFIILIPFLLAAPQLFPTIELFQNSARVPHDIKNILGTMLIQVWQLPMIVIQDFFGNPATKSYIPSDTYVGKVLSVGSVGFILALLSFFQKKKSWHFWFFSISALVLLVLNVHTPLSDILYRVPIPLLSTGTPTRNLFLFSLSLSVLAGFGFDTIRQLNRKYLIRYTALILGILGILALFVFLYPHIPNLPETLGAASTMKRALMFGGVCIMSGLGIIIVSQKVPLATWLIFPLVVFELFYGFIKFNPFVPVSYVFPEASVYSYLEKEGGIHRYWGYGTAQIDENYASQYHVYSPEGTDPLQFGFYNALLQSTKDGYIARTFTSKTRADALIAPGYGEKNLPENPFRLRMLDVLGVKYIIDRVDNPKSEVTFPQSRYTKVWEDTDGWIIYVNKLAAPRFFFATGISFYQTMEEFEQKFFDPSFSVDKNILLTSNDQTKIPEVDGKGNIEMISYAPWEIVYKTKTEAPQLLFLSDTYDTGWHAYSDGERIPLFRANYAFRAALVPEGEHTISMRYEPLSFTIGIYLVPIGILLMVMSMIFSRKHEK